MLRTRVSVAEGLVWANLRGVDGHGVARLSSYLMLMERGEIDPKAQPRLLQDRGAIFVLDGGFGFGPPAMMQAIAIAAERARTLGVGFGLVRETTHTGAVGRYAQWLAERGCAALIMVSGPAFVAYHGARVASMGTSPIAIAVPSGGGPIVLDMATSTISNGTIIQARANGMALPPGTVLTADGEPTTDPRHADVLLPLGGPKGSGLSLMFEMLASVLAAAPIQARALGPERRKRRTQNCAILAIDVETFRPHGGFRARRRYACGDPQIAAAASGVRRNPAARRALRPHRSEAPQVRHSDSGETVGGAGDDRSSK